MGLIFAAIHTLVPLLGPLFTLIWGPVLIAGTVLAAHTAASGRTPLAGQLFTLFRNGRLGEGVKLCLPLVAGKITAAIVLSFGLVSHLRASGMDIATLEQNRQLFSTLMNQIRTSAMRPWWITALIIVLFSWTIAALAIPRVALTRDTAMAAMARGFRLVWHHVLAWIVAGGLVFVLLTILTGLLMLTRISLVMELGVLTGLYTVLGPLLYVAWRDLDGATGTTNATPPSTPEAPPPSGYLEA